MEIILLLFIFFGGMVFGIEYTKNRITRSLNKMAERAEEEEEQGDDNVLPLKFETHGDNKVVYCYNRDTGDFLAQSDDVNELLQRIQDRFPKKEMIAVKEELESMVDLTTAWKTTK